MRKQNQEEIKAQNVTLTTMWEAGAPLEKIAEAIHLSISGVAYRRQALNLPARQVGNHSGIPRREGEGPTTKPSSDLIFHPARIRCLCCGDEFQSEDKKRNRICGPCKESDGWKLANEAPYESPSPRFKRMGAG